MSQFLRCSGLFTFCCVVYMVNFKLQTTIPDGIVSINLFKTNLLLSSSPESNMSCSPSTRDRIGRFGWIQWAAVTAHLEAIRVAPQPPSLPFRDQPFREAIHGYFPRWVNYKILIKSVLKIMICKGWKRVKLGFLAEPHLPPTLSPKTLVDLFLLFYSNPHPSKHVTAL